MSVFSSKPRWAKVGLLGFMGSGKTWTAIDIALWLHKRIASARPLMVFDSEGGIEYQFQRIVNGTGQEPDGIQSKSFADLMKFTHMCEPGDVALIDGMTQPWHELLAACESKKGGRGLPAIMAAKEINLNFNEWYLGAPCHVVLCARAGFQFAYEEIDGKKQLISTGTKMKAEGELGFEPSLLIEMERYDRPDGTMCHRAIVKKDRFGAIDGRIYDDPQGKTFQPFFDLLDLGNTAPPGLDLRDKSLDLIGENGNEEFRGMLKERQIILEEIQDDLVSAFPGQSAVEKKAKVDLLRLAFGTSSWKALEAQFRTYTNTDLRAGREKLATEIKQARDIAGAEVTA